MDACIFCKIIERKIPARILYEDSDILAFEDIRPQAPVHVLVIPKTHYASLNDIPEDKMSLLGALLLRARDIARDRGVGESGFRIVLNTARDSGQDVFHIHFHILGGRRMTWPPG
ncbi:MAG: histidine triad nucleotide-binding protein [Acidobacteriota bacterium]|nr:histidine triad nucleotide-binding protein [Acidobacteriota bacterium]